MCSSECKNVRFHVRYIGVKGLIHNFHFQSHLLVKSASTNNSVNMLARTVLRLSRQRVRHARAPQGTYVDDAEQACLVRK